MTAHFEVEADRVAHQVLRGGSRRRTAVATTTTHGWPGVGERERASGPIADGIGSSGQSLDPGTRATFEARFGHSFANVRVHHDDQAARSADAMGAAAYTVGRHIVFGEGQYAPNGATGAFLLAHELTHTLQQPPGASPVIMRRRVPTGSALSSTVTAGATDLAAHEAGLLRVLRRAWDSLTAAEKATVRTAASGFGISGATDPALFAALATATPGQLRQFADAVRAARPSRELGDPALIDVGARPATADAANITTLVTNANRIFDAVAAGSRDADLTAIFGTSHVAAAKTKYAAARSRMNALHAANKIVTDRSGYSAEVFLGGLTNSSQIAVSPGVMDNPNAHGSVATLVHESMHAGNADVRDRGYPDDPAFTRLDAATKLTNAAHFEVVAWRMLEPANREAFSGQTFIPAGTSVGGVSVAPLTPREQAMRDAKEAFRGAWTAGLNLHKLWVRVFRAPMEWATLDLATAFRGAASGAHFSETLPFWSKVELLTVHERPGINPAGTAAERPVTQIDVSLSEGLIRKLAIGMFGVPATPAATQAFEQAEATSAERTAAAASVAAETSLLKRLVVRARTGQMTGSETRDVRVVDRMAAAHVAPDFTDLLARRPPSAFP